MAIYIRDLCSKCINEVLTVLREFYDYTGLAAIVKSTLVTAQPFSIRLLRQRAQRLAECRFKRPVLGGDAHCLLRRRPLISEIHQR
jgi:hypothetical protein